jgi:hypothetical protein
MNSSSKYYDENEDFRVIEESVSTMASMPAYQVILYDYSNNNNFKTLHISSLINSDDFLITYYSDPGYFDQYLPIAKKMINSFQITSGNNNTLSPSQEEQYNMNGQKTCSYIFTRPSSTGIQYAVMDVSIFDASNSRIFMLSYANSQDGFDIDLPMVEKMTDSFQITK